MALLQPVSKGSRYPEASHSDYTVEGRALTKLRYTAPDGRRYGLAFIGGPTDEQRAQAQAEAEAVGATLEEAYQPVMVGYFPTE